MHAHGHIPEDVIDDAPLTARGDHALISRVPQHVSVLLHDGGSDRIVFSAGEGLAHPPASITKLLTLCLVDERLQATGGRLSDTVAIPAGAEAIDSWWGFASGELVEIGTLMRASAIVSSNEAAHALAEWHSGSIARFTARLNERARELGLLWTRFSSPSGLGRHQEITAHDALGLARHVLTRHPRVAALCGERSFSWKGKSQPSTNRLLDTVPGADGLKTGSLRGRGNHILFSAQRAGRRWICVVLGVPTKAERDEIVRLAMQVYAAS